MSRNRTFEYWVGFKDLGGRDVSLVDIASELSNWPIDGILGYLACISVDMVKDMYTSFYDPTRQGAYMNQAIVDDFPCVIPNAFRMYAPGRVPFTGGRHLFVHEQNIALLTHLAILHAKTDQMMLDFSEPFKQRVCRLLLILNDLISQGHDCRIKQSNLSLRTRRDFSTDWLRNWQFNSYQKHSYYTYNYIARQWLVFTEFLPKYYGNITEDFERATGGVSIEWYFLVLFLFINHLSEGIQAGTHWMSKDTLCSNIVNNRKDIEIIMDSWIRSPEEYRNSYKESISSRKTEDERVPMFDFTILREKPLIEARPGYYACPVFPFLFNKIMEGPYYILSDNLDNPQQFQSALGCAYQDYAHFLINQIANIDARGKWECQYSPRTAKDYEIADTYLQRGKVGIAFEHKGQRLGTEFVVGGSGERVFGPSDGVIEVLDSGIAVTLREGRKGDSGLITRGLWQQSKAGELLLEWAEDRLNVAPTIVYPVITHFMDFRIDDVVNRAYLKELINIAGLYEHDFWAYPQWLNISDLETMVSLCENKETDIEQMFYNKDRYARYERFDTYLHNNYQWHRVTSLLEKTAEEIMTKAFAFFKV